MKERPCQVGLGPSGCWAPRGGRRLGCGWKRLSHPFGRAGRAGCCRATLEGSIKWAAVAHRGAVSEAIDNGRASLEESLRAEVAAHGGRGGHALTAGVLGARAVARGARQRISPSRRP